MKVYFSVTVVFAAAVCFAEFTVSLQYALHAMLRHVPTTPAHTVIITVIGLIKQKIIELQYLDQSAVQNSFIQSTTMVVFTTYGRNKNSFVRETD
jgi:hypothetical protein